MFQRVQTGLCDPLQIGDKPKWYQQSLTNIAFKVYDESNSSLAAAIIATNEQRQSDNRSTGRAECVHSNFIYS